MEKPFQSMIAFPDDWLIDSEPPAGDPITADPAVTLPRVGNTGAARAGAKGAAAHANTATAAVSNQRFRILLITRTPPVRRPIDRRTYAPSQGPGRALSVALMSLNRRSERNLPLCHRADRFFSFGVPAPPLQPCSAVASYPAEGAGNGKAPGLTSPPCD